ncbi:oligopeptide ABC transporter substrate-binding protein OppA [Xenorhabdus bovienii]|uniref:Oligopeptide ABC transporter substrate-binding protein OppA n=2 Tax=Xenorhabdus bovienii TaxID=40576 RepID=A0AAJ1JDF1_XENBV|nr:ABC transporter substrate-binding protein [Xenorhabdus bovienii]MDE1480442.1 oligopeptide ABC transporter substrate-binding protein OppA [Xenorhabdus bovienii]MDE1490748.1 oligopeptide ABC transporter substrate-binding protein OppA [Xenorhabdus bovienii]MDE1495288.1 oligopeptide ABC transporter substrate-binding protein OppA [Xenorhabdus bovienii]MDE9473371.1 oligopeptide ABC transporter substrate-binding protein OppA [Xenorhabdus bovienii]MDE9512175.1 oligopeptide ABC transporter substrate
MENINMQNFMVSLIKNKIAKALTCIVSLILGSVTYSYAAVIPSGTQLADKQEITRNNFSEPVSLDPHKSDSSSEFDILRDFFERMVAIDKKDKIIPALAERWETNDNKTWVFHLRKGIKWSDGSPITAHDVVFSWRRMVTPDTISPYGSYLVQATVVNAYDVLSGKKKPEELGVKALDDATIEVTLGRPKADLLQMMAHPVMSPISEKVVKKYGNKWTQPEFFVSNGPFKLSEWIVNEKIVGVRNSYYWDDKHTVINKVTYLPLSDYKADLNRYMAGELDISNGGPSDFFPTLKKKFGDQFHISPIMSVYYYLFNTQKPPFNDVRVRQALTLALDRAIITDKVLGNGQKPAFDVVYPGSGGIFLKHPDYASWTQEQRVAKAKALLNEAGFNENNPLKFTLLYNTSDGHKKIAIAASSMWKKNLGVEVVLQNQESKSLYDTMSQGNFEVVRYAWNADYNSPTSFLDIFTTGNTNNIPQYSNKKFDQWVLKADETNDKIYYQRALDILTQDSPAIPVYYYVRTKLVKPYVGGVHISPLGDIPTKDLYIIKH